MRLNGSKNNDDDDDDDDDDDSARRACDDGGGIIINLTLKHRYERRGDDDDDDRGRVAVWPHRGRVRHRTRDARERCGRRGDVRWRLLGDRARRCERGD